jgi:hypothetical protein
MKSYNGIQQVQEISSRRDSGVFLVGDVSMPVISSNGTA